MIEWIITSCVLIVIVALLRLVLKGRISLRLQYALWIIVLARLLIPVNFISSPMSVMNVVPESVPVAELQQPQISYTPELAPSEQVDTPVSQVPILPVNPIPITPDTPEVQEPVELPEPQQQIEVPAPEKEFSYVLLLQIIWVSGIAITAIIFLFANIRFALRLKRTRQTENIDCRLKVYRTAIIDTPCLFGLFRPAIYLTEEAGEDVGRQHILTHELTHYKHWDHIWGFFRCLCLAVHWYNPLVWLAAILSRRDSELACDESVIKQLGEEHRAEYGKTLIRMTCTKQAVGSIITTATTMTGSKKTLTQRIKLIAKHPKTALYAAVCLVLVAAIAVGCTFTGKKQVDKESKEETVPMETTPEETEISTEKTTEPETSETIDETKYPEVLECGEAEGFVTLESLAESKACRVYARKYRNPDNPYSYDLYVDIDTGTEILSKYLESNVFQLPSVGLFLGDVDGDKVEEILLHSNTGGVGGFGLWQTWVLKVEDGEICVLFKNFDGFDTGFESRFLEDYRLEITNHITGYNLVFDVKDDYKSAYKSAKEPPTSYKLGLDPFCFFEPEDVDHDGISEIVCRQYTSHIGHADYTGTAHSVLKFNIQTQKFEVIDAWYEPYLPERELSEEEVLELLRKQMDVPHSYVIEETYIDLFNFKYIQETIQNMARDGTWYYKVDRNYRYMRYNQEEHESMEYYYIYEGDDLIYYVKDQDSKTNKGVVKAAVLEQMEKDRQCIDSGTAIYPQYLTDFKFQGIDQETGFYCYTYNLPVHSVLADETMYSAFIMLAMEMYGTKYFDIWEFNVRCTALVDPETMCTMSIYLDYEELKPYVMDEGSISAEYALMTNFFCTKYTFDYELIETTVIPDDFE